MSGTAREIRGLYAIIDTGTTGPSEVLSVAGEVLAGGARLVQLRAHPGLADARYLELARSVAELAHKYEAIFIVNDRVDIAVLANADGVHLGLDDMAIKDARRILPAGAIIGASTHNQFEARAAERAGADYVSLGPVFITRTKKNAHTPRGLDMLKKVAGAVGVPVVAIGGITEAECAEVIGAGASAVAMISELTSTGDVQAKTASVARAIGSALDRSSSRGRNR